jgi:hypothetical protein
MTCTIKKKQGEVGRRGLYRTIIMQTCDEWAKKENGRRDIKTSKISKTLVY